MAPIKGDKLQTFLSDGGFAPESFPALEALTLRSLRAPVNERDEVQIPHDVHQCFPDVIEVTFVEGGFRDGVPALVSLWPNLQTLGLRGLQEHHFWKEDLINLVAAR